MKPLITFTLIVLTSICSGQGVIRINNISETDSINLIKTMRQYIKAVENRDKKIIKRLSLIIVDCEMCITNKGYDNPIEDAFVKIDTYEVYLFDNLKSSVIWKNIKDGVPIMTSTSTSPGENYHPKSVKLKQGEYFTEFEVSYLLNDSTDKYYFNFTKIENKFKLWGVRIAPY
jgi:hypothetical protein